MDTTQENTTLPAESSTSTFESVAGSNSTKSSSFSDMTSKASFGARVGAFLIDLFIITFVGGILGRMFGMGSVEITDTGYSSQVSGWMSLIIYAYFIVMDVKVGTTLGKMVFKLKVVDATTGEKLSWGKAILRELVGKFVSGAILGLGYLWMLWDKDKQCLHDKIGSSFVVKE